MSNNQRDEAKIDRVMGRVTKSAIQGSVVGLAVGLGVAGLLEYVLKNPTFKRLTPAGKAFLISSSAVAGFYISGETALINDPEDRRVIYRNKEEAILRAQEKPSMFSLSNILEYKYETLFGIWCTSMVGSLALSFKERNLLLSQKLVHARVYAQFATLGSLVALGLLSQIEPPKPHVEEPHPWDIKN